MFHVPYFLFHVPYTMFLWNMSQMFTKTAPRFTMFLIHQDAWSGTSLPKTGSHCIKVSNMTWTWRHGANVTPGTNYEWSVVIVIPIHFDQKS